MYPSRRKKKTVSPMMILFLLGTTMFLIGGLRFLIFDFEFPSDEVQSVLETTNSDVDLKGLKVSWYAPFWSGTGYGIEATMWVLGLYEVMNPDTLRIVDHGVLASTALHRAYLEGLPRETLELLFNLSNQTFELDPRTSVIVCNSMPYNWGVRRFRKRSPVKVSCPPAGFTGLKIGRTMFETERIPQSMVDKLRLMDEIWVPSQFCFDSFRDSGVPEDRLFILPEACDTDLYNPETTIPLSLPLPVDPPTSSIYSTFLSQSLPSSEVIGSQQKTMDLPSTQTKEEKEKIVESEQQTEMKIQMELQLPHTNDPNSNNPYSDYFKFISIFKWEERKGWDLLLQAFVQEFSQNDKVLLYILTREIESPQKVIRQFVRELFLRNNFPFESFQKTLNRIIVLPPDTPADSMPALYKACDAFVLPSHGEGWGRPHFEAMAMELPTIATNWSGNLMFMNDENSFPVSYTLVRSPDGFYGFNWALPNITHLQYQMRYVYTNREEARRVGRKARKDIVEQWSIPPVMQILYKRLTKIKRKFQMTEAKTRYSRLQSLIGAYAF